MSEAAELHNILIGVGNDTERRLRIGGAIEMVAGLEYHHGRFQMVMEHLRMPLSQPVDDLSVMTAYAELNMMLRHETTAFLNRLGQLRTFFRSDYALHAVPNIKDQIPLISRYKILRDRYTAHRAVDDPRTDSDTTRQIHDGVGMSGGFWMIKPDETFDAGSFTTWQELQLALYRSNFIQFRVDGRDGKLVTFTPEADGPLIIKEAATALADVIRITNPREAT